jgi:Holliday junction resolvase
MTAETKFKNKVKKWLDKNGIYHIPYGASMYTKAGVPDTLMCIRGRFVGIEFKAEKGKLSEIQKYQIEQIRKAGGIVFVLYPKDFDDFKIKIKEMD